MLRQQRAGRQVSASPLAGLQSILPLSVQPLRFAFDISQVFGYDAPKLAQPPAMPDRVCRVAWWLSGAWLYRNPEEWDGR